MTSFLFRSGLDPKHKKLLDKLAKEWGTTTASGTLSMLLDRYERDRDLAKLNADNLAALLNLADRLKAERIDSEALARSCDATLGELLATAAQVRKLPRQTLIR